MTGGGAITPAARRIVDVLAGLRREQPCAQRSDLGRCVELAAALAGGSGELRDRPLVRLAEQIGRAALIGQRAERLKVVEEVGERLWRDRALVVEVDGFEDAVELLRVGVGDPQKRVVDGLAEPVLVGVPNVGPEAAVRGGGRGRRSGWPG